MWKAILILNEMKNSHGKALESLGAAISDVEKTGQCNTEEIIKLYARMEGSPITRVIVSNCSCADSSSPEVVCLTTQ